MLFFIVSLGWNLLWLALNKNKTDVISAHSGDQKNYSTLNNEHVHVQVRKMHYLLHRHRCYTERLPLVCLQAVVKIYMYLSPLRSKAQLIPSSFIPRSAASDAAAHSLVHFWIFIQVRGSMNCLILSYRFPHYMWVQNVGEKMTRTRW